MMIVSLIAIIVVDGYQAERSRSMTMIVIMRMINVADVDDYLAGDDRQHHEHRVAVVEDSTVGSRSSDRIKARVWQ